MGRTTLPPARRPTQSLSSSVRTYAKGLYLSGASAPHCTAQPVSSWSGSRLMHWLSFQVRCESCVVSTAVLVTAVPAVLASLARADSSEDVWRSPCLASAGLPSGSSGGFCLLQDGRSRISAANEQRAAQCDAARARVRTADLRRAVCRPLQAHHSSVGNTVFGAFAPLQPGRPALPRPEGPRQSLRSGSRSDSFWGSGQGGCTEMHYSPRIWQKRGPELALLFPLPLLPSPSSSLPPLSARGPGSQGGRRVRRDHGPQSATSLLCF